SGDTHAHDGGDLRDAHGRHDRIVAEDAAEIVGVREDVFLQREEDSGRVDEVDRRDAIFDGDVLRPDNFLRGHGKEGASFDGGVVHDEHDHPGLDAGESGDDAGGGGAAPFFVHFVRGIEAEFEERAGVGEELDALTRGEARFGVLAFDGFGASAFADFFFFVADLGDEVGERAHVGFEAKRAGVNFGREDVVDGESGGFDTFAHEGRLRNNFRNNLLYQPCEGRSAAIKNAALLSTGRGKRRALQSKNAAEARIPARLADRDGGNRGVARVLYVDGSSIHAVSASGCGADSQQCAHREFAGAARSSLCVAWNLGALRYALVLAYRRARLRSAHGGDLLSVVSGGDSAREWVDTSDGGGASGLDLGGIPFLLGTAAPGRGRIIGGGETPHAAAGLCVADQFRAIRGLLGVLDPNPGGLGRRLWA